MPAKSLREETFEIFSANTCTYNSANGDVLTAAANTNWAENVVESSNVALVRSAGWHGTDGHWASNNETHYGLATQTAGTAGYAIFKLPSIEGYAVSELSVVSNGRAYENGATISVANEHKGVFVDVAKPEPTTTSGRDVVTDVTKYAFGWETVFVKVSFPASSLPDRESLFNIRVTAKLVPRELANTLNYTIFSANKYDVDQHNKLSNITASDGWDDNIVRIENVDFLTCAGWNGTLGNTGTIGKTYSLYTKQANKEGSVIFKAPMTKGDKIRTLFITMNARAYQAGAYFYISDSADGTYTQIYTPDSATQSGIDCQIDVTSVAKDWTDLYIKVYFPATICPDWFALYDIRTSGTVTKGYGLIDDTSGYPESIEIVQGDTLNAYSNIYDYQLTANLLPEGSFYRPVAWSSSDESVLTVSNTGLVVTKKAGTAIVTAKTKDGRLSDTIKVVVTDREKPNFDYSFLVVPDTQNACTYSPEMLEASTQWFENNIDNEKMKFGIHLGDFTNANNQTEWQRSQNTIGRISDRMPFTGCIGNHDYPDTSAVRDSTMFNKYFPVSDQQNKHTWGGVFESGKADNVYHVFTVYGVDYLVVTLEFGPRDEVIDWANTIVAKYPNHRAIIVTHQYLDRDGVMKNGSSASASTYGMASQAGNTVNDAEDLWNKLIRKHANIFMVLCGHIEVDDIYVFQATGDKGNTVLQIIADSQIYEGTGLGVMMLMKFDEANRKIHFEYYISCKDSYFRERNQFSIDIPTEFTSTHTHKTATT